MPYVDGRCSAGVAEAIVDDGQAPMRCRLGECRKVDDLHQRVGRCFAKSMRVRGVPLLARRGGSAACTISRCYPKAREKV